MILETIAIGVLGGILSGMFGVGGGIVFVPALVAFMGLTQVEAEATSLVAIVPVALVGSWRQWKYGNVKVADGVGVGVLAALGALAGVALANALSGEALRIGFGILTILMAVQLARRAFKETPAPEEE